MPMYRSWPVVPRPFDDEAFGSWFGRIAARYRIRVDELASAAGVSLDHEGLWLVSRPPQGQALQRLAMLCRLPARVIDAMAPQTLVVSRRFWYCYPCLDLNQQDVLSPYWRAAWLAQGADICSTHPGDVWWIEAEMIKRCAHMRDLVRYIRRKKEGLVVQERRKALRLYPYTSEFRGLR